MVYRRNILGTPQLINAVHTYSIDPQWSLARLTGVLTSGGSADFLSGWGQSLLPEKFLPL